MEKGSEGLPTLIYPLDNCFETEIITTEQLLELLNIVVLKLHLCRTF